MRLRGRQKDEINTNCFGIVLVSFFGKRIDFLFGFCLFSIDRLMLEMVVPKAFRIGAHLSFGMTIFGISWAVQGEEVASQSYLGKNGHSQGPSQKSLGINHFT